MNFDGRTSTKSVSLRGPTLLGAGTTEETEYVSPSGYRHALFVINCNISGARSITGKIEQTANIADPGTTVAGTEFSMSVADGDSTTGIRTILVSHAAVAQEFLRVSVTHAGGTNVVPVIGCIQFNSVNSDRTATVSAVKG